MMMNFNATGGSLGHHFHLLFGLMLLAAFVLLIIWAGRFAKKDELKNWIIGLLIIGILGWLVTAYSFDTNWRHHFNGKFGPGVMALPGMTECMQDEDCHDDMEDLMDRMMGTEEEAE